MTIKQLSDGNPDGTVLGQSSTDKISFFGATPVVRQSNITAVTTTASTTTTLAAGYTTTAQADAIVTAINSIITALDNLGLTA